MEERDMEYRGMRREGGETLSGEARQEGRNLGGAKFGVDLTQAAAEGSIDPVTGREEQIERMVQILCRRKKNNPVLVGEAGVGKSAIVEGLALRIAGGEVPHTLRGKRVFALDLASMVAGTKYRGQFEERLKSVIDEAADDGRTILFIDELHTIVGTGASDGGMDTANILKPALSRGGLQCVGATTLDEYRQSIEKDPALERRFQKIVVPPATPAHTLEILGSLRPHYESHHMVRYTDEALAACVELTGRYVNDREFPDKAIDAMDEAGARAHLGRRHGTAEMEQLQTAISEVGDQHREAIARRDFAATINARIRRAALDIRMDEARGEWLRELGENPVEITAGHVEQVITSMTGIPVERVSQKEGARLRGMAEALRRVVVGQDEAVEKVAGAVLRSRAGLKDPTKPIGVFMFVGPTGVGKTLLARELNSWLFDRPEALLRIDMSEYAEKHNVSRLTGSPPGYVGYGEGGQLTEAVRRQPYSVVLFDEIEKAHPDVLNAMLQIFDDGSLTDGLGRRVDFRNTVIIMTSNVGSASLARRGQAIGFTTASTPKMVEATANSRYRNALEETFTPEFINRVDDIVIFNPLPRGDMERIVELRLAELADRAKGAGYALRATPAARRRLAELGYDARYGARALGRAIREHVEDPLARLIVEGDGHRPAAVRIDSKRGRISLSVESKKFL